jgi:hypothetical protein
MRGDLQISHYAEMIACPDSGNSFVEDAPAVSNCQSGSVNATSDHDVIDPRPISSGISPARTSGFVGEKVWPASAEGVASQAS